MPAHAAGAAGGGGVDPCFIRTRSCRPQALQSHELCGRGRDRHRRKVRDRHARLVPHRSRRLPRGGAGHTRPPTASSCMRARSDSTAPRRPRKAAPTRCASRAENFVIAAARQCRSGQTPAPFTQINPTRSDDGNLVAYLAEDSEYDDEQARLAGIQRLLIIAGYDAAPIDGVDGPKTQAALNAFLKSRGLPADAVQSQSFFTTMIEAVQSPSATGLTWCNDTPHKIMAAVATDDGKTVTSRGWYRIDPGKCLHPDVTGQPKQVFSFAEAVDNENRTVKYRGPRAELGRHHAALHPREQVRDQRTGRLRHPRACRGRFCSGRHDRRRQDAAVCDAMMVLREHSSSPATRLRQGFAGVGVGAPKLQRRRQAGDPVRRASRLERDCLWNTGSPGPVSAKASPGHELARPPKLQRRRQAGR